ncbi:hypothetical protein [Aeromonas hydrophila]|uniref:hypothetical protein n=2 Tax=Aeromonas hydrophila TaxID=644 RepID=UPI0018D7E2B3|nr:hypothetical protein [Aeromonas hydrophila]QPR86228.1 hypothetical protein I6G73_11950 [Aeromonas hydrophila]
MMKPYVKTLEDELDWKLLDQLHTAVAQISNFCFEIKKFCVTTLLAVLMFVLKFTSDKLDESIFIAGFLITFCFWFLDSTAYFYQVKLRGMMEAICEQLAARKQQRLVIHRKGSVIESSRVSAPIHKRILGAGFNHSMWIYALLILIDGFLLGLFKYGVIK